MEKINDRLFSKARIDKSQLSFVKGGDGSGSQCSEGTCNNYTGQSDTRTRGYDDSGNLLFDYTIAIQ